MTIAGFINVSVGNSDDRKVYIVVVPTTCMTNKYKEVNQMKETKLSRGELNTSIVVLSFGFLMFGGIAISLINNASTMSMVDLLMNAGLMCGVLVSVLGIAWCIPHMIKGFHEPAAPRNAHRESWQ